MTTKETHVTTRPPEHMLGRIADTGSARVLKEGDPRHLQEYRSPDPTLNMTLKVSGLFFSLRNSFSISY